MPLVHLRHTWQTLHPTFRPFQRPVLLAGLEHVARSGGACPAGDEAAQRHGARVGADGGALRSAQRRHLAR